MIAPGNRPTMIQVMRRSSMCPRSRHAIVIVIGIAISSCGTGASLGSMSASSGTDTMANPTPTTPWIKAAAKVMTKARIHASMDIGGRVGVGSREAG